MSRFTWSLYVLGAMCIGTSLRRYGDLGDLVPFGAFLSLLAIGFTAVVLATRPTDAAAPGEVSKSHSAGAVLALVAGTVGLLAPPSEMTSVLAGMAALLLVGHVTLRGSSVPVAVSAVVVAFTTTWFFDHWMLVRAELDAVALPLAACLRWLGVSAVAQGDLVHVTTLKTDQGFKVDANTMGLATHAIPCIHWYCMRWLGTAASVSTHWRLWQPIAYLATAVFLRFTFFVAIGIMLENGVDYESKDVPLAGWFDWRFLIVIDALAGLIAAALVFDGRVNGRAGTGVLRPWFATDAWPRWLLPGAAAVFGLGLAMDRVLDCVGSVKPGRIAIEEGHSRWESSDIRAGRDVYGSESGYNFRGIADWLESIYGPIRRIYEPISTSTLTDVDVLVIKTPTEEFPADEVAAIQAFVAAGGGLILIGDHTNVYGTSEVLNRIAEPMGFRFRYDCLFDQRRRFEFYYTTEGDVRNHQVLRGVKSILFEVGCSIEVNSNRVRPILVGRGLKCQPIDFGVENFYPHPADTADLQMGQFPIVVTRAIGRGRVVAISDSTLFSTFSVFMPGRREIVEGMVAHANQTDIGEGVRRTMRRLAWLLGLVLVAALRGRSLASTTALGILALGTWNAAVGCAEGWLCPQHPASRAGTTEREVSFVRDESDVDWPVAGFPKDADRCFDLFFQYTSRVGAFPRLVNGVDAALLRGGAMVLIDPKTRDDAKNAAALVRHAETGGTVIAMESAANALVDHLAAGLGVALRSPADHEVSLGLRTPDGDVEHKVPRPTCRTIDGGTPFLVSKRSIDGSEPDERPVGVVVARGEGQVVLITCGQSFSNSDYGYRYATIPDQSLRRLYEIEYTIMAAAIGVGPDAEGER